MRRTVADDTWAEGAPARLYLSSLAPVRWLPTHFSPSKAPPAMTRLCLGRPSTFENSAFGLSSPANPALITPLPASTTTGTAPWSMVCCFERARTVRMCTGTCQPTSFGQPIAVACAGGASITKESTHRVLLQSVGRAATLRGSRESRAGDTAGFSRHDDTIFETGPNSTQTVLQPCVTRS